MKLILDKNYLLHDTGNHPENAGRFVNFINLEEYGDVENLDNVSAVHPKEYTDFVREKSLSRGYFDADTPFSENSYKAAVSAVNTSVYASTGGNFALVRPPGHHAYSKRAAGFCFFNNIACAAQKISDTGKNIAIIDIDGHFGDGTSDIFYESSNVLYISLHQFPAYPGKGYFRETGLGKGEGYNINIQLPQGSGDDLVRSGFDEVILPVLKEFNPDFIGVSAGFDGIDGDGLLSLRFSPGIYHYIGKVLKGTGSSLFAVLEGGYDPDNLYSGVMNFVNGVNGFEIFGNSTYTDTALLKIEEFETNMGELKKLLSNFWKKLKVKN